MLNEKDTMWVDLRHKHFADAINDISSQVRGLLGNKTLVEGVCIVCSHTDSLDNAWSVA